MLRSLQCYSSVVLAYCLLLLGAEQAMAIVPDYVPVSAAWLRDHRFPMRTVGHFHVSKAPANLPIGIGNAQITSTNRDGAGMAVTIHGCAKDGTTWEATISGGCCTDAFDLNIADLDNNGQKDAVITFRIATTGLESVVEHLMLLFDANGLPTPHITVGCYLDESDKMLDFVDLDDDGRAEVFDQNMRNDKWWFDIYRADNTRWKRVSRWPALDSVPVALRNRPCGTMAGIRSLDTKRFVAGGKLQNIVEDAEGNTCLVLVKPTGATETICLLYSVDINCIMIVETPTCRRILFTNAHNDEWKRTLAELAFTAPRFYGAGDLGSPPWRDEPKLPSPMIAWFFAGFPEGTDRTRFPH
ncbi:MAG: hypothetical protein WA705_12660 [Candidatus Ozemobacteraceae bacterium]